MIVGIIIVGCLAFPLGCYYEKYRWARAAKKDKIMVVDGDMYKVKQYAENSGGSVER